MSYVETREPEVALLTSRFNAHMTFNVLNALKGIIIEGNRDEAGDLLDHYAKILRRMLINGNMSSTVEDELETIVDYLELERIRLNDIFHYRIETSNAMLSLKVPKSVLVSLVENAVKHGMRFANLNGFMGQGFIRIESSGSRTIIVSNNAPLEIQTSGQGSGIALTRQIIKYYNQQTDSHIDLVINRKARDQETLIEAILKF